MWMNYGWHMGWMLLWWGFGAALIALFVWLLVGTAAPAVREGDSPERILKRRYASGDIDRDEYERRLSDLRK